jgi:Protein of unknown function (DUF4238)
MYLAGEAEPLTVPVRDAAVRRDFYSRKRPTTGERIDDIEWSLSHLENASLPVLQEIGDLWPLNLDNKGRLAALFGYQLIRGPRWMGWHAEFTDKWAEEKRADPGDATAEQIDQVRDHLLSATPRLTRMLSLGPKVASVLGSMHWSLIEFGSSLLATSDHPVVVWPAGQRSRRPQPSPLNTRLLETLEVVVPLSSERALLMTWLDRKDDSELLRGYRQQAATLNAFVTTQAEQQWFHAPGRKPPIAVGQLLPVSSELHRGYDAAVVMSSRRRAEIAQRIHARIGSDDLEQEFEIVSVE